jgi:transposase
VGETRRRFTEEFKREAVALSYSSGKTIREVAADLGIHRSLLNKCRADVRRLEERAFPGHGVQRLTP